MKKLRWGMTIAIVACLAPALGLLVAVLLAKLNDCTLNEGFVTPCIVLGRDAGGTLYTLAVSGWLMLATLPIAGGLAIVWAAVEVAAAIRRRNSA